MKLPSIGIEQQDVDVLLSPTAYKEIFLDHIKQAKTRIYITALYLQDDEAGREILTALYRAKVQTPTLDISIFVDAHRAQRGLIGQKTQLGNRAMYAEFAQKHQVNINFYGIAVKPKELLGVLHLKGIVIDDMLLYSGASINNVYLHQHNNYRLDRYYLIRSTALAKCFCQYLVINFIESGVAIRLTDTIPITKKQKKIQSKKTRAIVKRADYQFAEVNKTSAIQITPFAGCGSRRNQLNHQVCQLIKDSTESIVLFTPYFNLPRAVTKQLTLALKRGVKITVIVGDKTASDFYIADPERFSLIGIIPYIYEQILRKFLKRWQKFVNSGQLVFKLWQDEGNSYHLKGLVVDETKHLLTGSNLNPRAWGLDLENGLLLQDPTQQLLAGFQQELASICQHTRDITSYKQIDSQRDYPLKPRKLLARLSMSKVDRLLKRFL
ncbi:CDP-diacylglycerol--serine O-phosphatidyltransferase [Thalassotalea castellviae]|uniref:CDP-diacylglycerol--serine O-phosphatidyltransferase n=1 Tax=Thalassotalea castellviae TaxID=3075612 RepID=A0ABU3A0X4_9GAMM|nr:CDP-diacylglycerol--serine O-phosphatidyltransferase [Thalassotalea sp. W431]MDT0603197.1 CDP-diacylglycerol--serine O-phosphatidyltransferase [Thalassotalea sp. W431]